MDDNRILYEEELKLEKEFLQSVGLKIRKYRLECNWSQEELGLRSNLDRTYIGGIERGERNISILKLKKLADVLQVSISDLTE